MPHQLTGHEQDVLATLVQRMGNSLDEFDMEVEDHIERASPRRQLQEDACGQVQSRSKSARQRSWLKRAKEQGFLTISVTIAKSLP